MTDEWNGCQDDVLLAIVDGEPLPLDRLVALPPWRAHFIAQVAVKAGSMSPAQRDLIHAEASRIGGLGHFDPSFASALRDMGAHP